MGTVTVASPPTETVRWPRGDGRGDQSQTRARARRICAVWSPSATPPLPMAYADLGQMFAREIEQGEHAVKPAALTGQRAVGAEYPVAGNDDRHRRTAHLGAERAGALRRLEAVGKDRLVEAVDGISS